MRNVLAAAWTMKAHPISANANTAMFHSVRRTRTDVTLGSLPVTLSRWFNSGIFLGLGPFEHISQAAHGMDQFGWTLRVDLLAQPADMDVHDVRIAVFVPPYMLYDRIAVKDAPFVARQQFEQRVLLGRKDHLSPRAEHAAQACIDLQVRDPDRAPL